MENKNINVLEPWFNSHPNVELAFEQKDIRFLELARNFGIHPKDALSWLAKKLGKNQNHYSILEQAGIPSYESQANKIKKNVTLIYGPTNSGKTYKSLEFLDQAGGVYCAPLRLMALENYELFIEKYSQGSLLTGEEKMLEENIKYLSCTVEMMPDDAYPVCILDEFQMCEDYQRGWAWISALARTKSKNVILTGSVDALNPARKICEKFGYDFSAQELQRKTSLTVLKQPVRIEEIERHDAVIAFSRKEVLSWREILQKQGLKVSCIYGSLGAEVRSSEAKKLRDGVSDVVIATDAIGMGLNLPIKRVLFSTLEKYDGKSQRYITQNEMKQISGRAGRFKLFDAGFYGVIEPTETSEFNYLRPNVKPNTYRTQLPLESLQTIAYCLNTDSLFEVCSKVNESEQSGIFKTEYTEEQMVVLEFLEQSPLSFEQKFAYMNAPVQTRSSESMRHFVKWADGHGLNKTVNVPKLQKMNDDLSSYEVTANLCLLYLWFHQRFPEHYTQNLEALDLKNECNRHIELILSRHPKNFIGKKKNKNVRGQKRAKNS